MELDALLPIAPPPPTELPTGAPSSGVTLTPKTKTTLATSGVVNYPAALPVELALGEIPEALIAETYGMTLEELAELKANPSFDASVVAWRSKIKDDGLGFKIKAALLAEQALPVAWGLINSVDTPAATRADLVKWLADASGQSQKGRGTGETGPKFALQINIGGTSHNVVVDAVTED
jgi:hypothetical protein